jgi:hypothetical protein
MTIRISMELPEKASTNVLYRLHGIKRWKTEQQFYLAVKEVVTRERIKPVTAYPIVAVYAFEVPGKQLDVLNLSGMAKMVEDGLRHAGILIDDTPAYVAGVSLRCERSKDKRIRVSVSWEQQGSASRSVGSRPSKRRSPRAG